MGEGALRRSAISPRVPLFLSPAHVQQICTTVPVVRFFLVLHMYNRSVLLHCTVGTKRTTTTTTTNQEIPFNIQDFVSQEAESQALEPKNLF